MSGHESKMRRFVKVNWVVVVQLVAWLALSLYWDNELIESGWIPKHDADFAWWWLKGVFVVLVARLTVYGTALIIQLVVERWRRA